MYCYMNLLQLVTITCQAGQLQSDGIGHMARLLGPIVKYIRTRLLTVQTEQVYLVRLQNMLYYIDYLCWRFSNRVCYKLQSACSTPDQWGSHALA